MEMTALGPFTERLAGRLSGGMKQKLGLACTLVRAPELLLLDEPTVGVDPLSRRELWNIILQLVNEQGMTVLLSTSYLDEAERCGHVAVMHQGNILAQGSPHDISSLAEGRVFLAEPPARPKGQRISSSLIRQAEVVDAVPEGGRVRIVVTEKMKDEIGKLKETVQSGSRGDKETARQEDSAGLNIVATSTQPRFEDGFMVLLKAEQGEWETRETRTRRKSTRLQEGRETNRRFPALLRSPSLPVSPSPDLAMRPSLRFTNLVRRFGNFVAVDHVTFEVQRGEIFGLLGPNGAGKTTTFRMLCGLLPASEGMLRVAGVDLRRARASARQHIGYVAQKFSLYGQLSVSENLEFFARAYNLRGAQKTSTHRVGLQQFELAPWQICQAAICPAVLSSVWRWRRRCCMSRKRFFSTSRPAARILWPVAISGGALPRSPKKE